MALNPDTEGDATAFYLHRLLSPASAEISRIARGIPVGGDLEFADQNHARPRDPGARTDGAMNLANALTMFRLVAAPVFVFLLVRETRTSLWIASIVFVVATLTDASMDTLRAEKAPSRTLGACSIPSPTRS